MILEESGLPKGMKDNVKIFKKKRNSYVNVEPLPAETCSMLIEELDMKEISIGDKRLLHCGGLTLVSPIKYSVPKSPASKSPPSPPAVPGPSRWPPVRPPRPPSLSLTVRGPLPLYPSPPSNVTHTPSPPCPRR